ncbi:MAG: hypothetical protein M3Y87_03120 [Myxococcota bacterium]|nr:hypothetical protein [Myxococcota bacterium]
MLESFAWIDIALTGVPYDPERDLVFALDYRRVIPTAYAEKLRAYFDEWGPFPGATDADISLAARTVANKCGGGLVDLTVLLTYAARAQEFPRGSRLTSTGPSLDGILAYLSRCTPSEWPRIVTAVQRRSFPSMGSPDDLLMTLLNYQLERGAPRVSSSARGSR